MEALPAGQGALMTDRLALLVPAPQRELLRQALADALHYRDPPVECRACDERDGLCDACAAGLSRGRAYLALGRELGVQEPGAPGQLGD